MKTRRILYFPFLVVAMLMLSQCGPIFDITDLNELLPQWKFGNRGDAEGFFQQADISCDSADCPSYALGFYTITGEDQSFNVTACSATLIAPDQVLTNRHCVPEDLRKTGASCQGRIRFVFPKTATYALENFDCSEIQALSDDYDHAPPPYPDWAILKMSQRTQRKFIATNTEGIEPSQLVSIYTVEFSLEKIIGEVGKMKRIRCLANTDFIYSSDFFHQHSPLMNISECDDEILSGSSGAGYVNKDQQLIGLHSFSFSPQAIAEERDKIDFPLEDNFGGGSNLHCIQEFNSDLDPYCSFDFTQDYQVLKAGLRYLWQSQAFVQATGRASMDGDEILQASQWIPTLQHILTDRVASDLIKNLLPAIPECLPPGTLAGQLLSLPVLIGQEAQTQPENLHLNRSFSRNNLDFVVQVDSEGFTIQAQGSPLLASEVREVLGINLLDDLEISIPTCAL